MTESTSTPAQSDTEPTEAVETEPATGYGYLTEAEAAAAVADHKRAVDKNSKGSK